MSQSTDSNSRLTSDSVFELLSSKRRRMVLFYLRQEREPTSVNELAEQIAAMENEVEVEDLTSQQQKRVYVSLYQTHLPKLEAMGVIDYDKEAGQVALNDRAVEIDSYLSPASSQEYPWQLHYLVLALGSVAVLLLTVFEAPGVAAVPPVYVGIAIALAFATSALAHYLTERRRRREIPPELERDGFG